jgi:hypothetical protein
MRDVYSGGYAHSRREKFRRSNAAASSPHESTRQQEVLAEERHKDDHANNAHGNGGERCFFHR